MVFAASLDHGSVPAVRPTVRGVRALGESVKGGLGARARNGGTSAARRLPGVDHLQQWSFARRST